MENGLVVKSNNLIRARYNLTLNEQRIILYSVSLLDREKKDFDIVRFQVSDLTRLLDTTGERYTEFRNIAKGLMSKALTINTKESELVTSWLSSMEYIRDEGIVELEFSKKLIPYLLQLQEKFTRYELKNILSLQNKYSIRVYELLKSWEYKKKPKEIFLEDLRKYLGIGEDEYLRFSNFENRVLKVTRDEINQYTDLNINYEKLKTGRRITSIRFFIEPKDIEKEIYIDYLKKTYSVKEMQRKMGLGELKLSAEQIMTVYERAVKKAGDEDINLFEYIRLNYLKIKDKARNPYSYLLEALDYDYASAIGQINLDYYLHGGGGND
jgi:plasmid replication initiation protein